MKTLKKAHKQWSLCALCEDFDLIRRGGWTIVEPIYKEFTGNSAVTYILNTHDCKE
jgi:hypothetical protein